MEIKEGKFKEVSTDSERKLKYEGYCSKCKKITFHRLDGGTMWKTRYRCMKCKTINTEENVYKHIL